MTIAAMKQPNKPAKYAYRDGGMILVEDTDEPAEKSAELPSSDAIALLKGLVDLLADPKKAAQKIADLSDMVANANTVIAAAKVEQTKADEADDHIEKAQAAQNKKLADEKLAHEQAMERRLRDVEQREKVVADREKEADDLIAGLKQDRAVLDRKLEAVRKAASE
jgi:hypothetical protein